MTCGTAGRARGTYDQWGSQGAPSAIQRRRSATCASVSRGLPLFASGMRRVSSGSVTRATSALLSGAPATIGTAPERTAALAVASTSRRSPASRRLRSGPWQAKQLSARIGRTSRLKLTVDGPRGRVGAAAVGCDVSATTTPAGHGAPASIHRLIVSISAAGNGSVSCGMRWTGSLSTRFVKTGL